MKAMVGELNAEAAKAVLTADAAKQYCAGDMSATDDAGHEAIAREAANITAERCEEQDRCTRNAISRKLAAHAALTLLYHSHGDERGLELAAKLEAEAHAVWRDAGQQDCSTFELAVICAEA